MLSGFDPRPTMTLIFIFTKALNMITRLIIPGLKIQQQHQWWIMWSSIGIMRHQGITTLKPQDFQAQALPILLSGLPGALMLVKELMALIRSLHPRSFGYGMHGW